MLQGLTLAAVPPLRMAYQTESGAGRGLDGFLFRNQPIGEAAGATDVLFLLIFWFSVFFFVLLMALMIYWGFFKYRRRPGVPAARSVSHNGPLEVFWTVVPSSALLVIFALGMWAYTQRQVPYGDSLNLTINAWQWGWNATYPDGTKSQWTLPLEANSTQTVPVFVVPEDTNISFTMISADVIHAFWIPDFRVKMDVFPNRYSGYTITTPKLAAELESDPVYGRYQDHWIFCAEYCGTLHSEMAAVLRVMSYAGYQKWLEAMNTGDLTPAEIGKRVHDSKCASCHSVDGTSNVGPTWKGLYGSDVPLADGRTVKGDANYIRESILTPSAKVHAGFQPVMPPFQGLLTEQEIEGVIAYMKTLSKAGMAELESATQEGNQPAGENQPGGESPPDASGQQPAEGGAAAPADGNG